MKSDVLTVIPARYGSTRFPGKVLAKLDGRTIVEWCWRAAIAARLGPVLVATENTEVVRVVESFGGHAVLTPSSCVSGSDRVFIAARPYGLPFIINLQGDQPLINPATLRAVARVLHSNADTDMATAVIALDDEKRAQNPNVVKAVLARNARCIYFSRSPIPFARNSSSIKRWEHLGIYGFRRLALKRFVDLPPSPLEKIESLEQLRALEDGMRLCAAVVEDHPIAIDTPADLKRAEKILKSIRGHS